MNQRDTNDSHDLMELKLTMTQTEYRRVEAGASRSGQPVSNFIMDAAVAASSSDSAPLPETAILIDLDSLIDVPMLNLTTLEEWVHGRGRLTKCVSFGTMDSENLNAHRKSLRAANYLQYDLPSREALRIHMTMVANDLLQGHRTRRFVVLTSDELLSYSISTLRGRGAYITGVGSRLEGSFSASFIREFDDFYFYHRLEQPTLNDQLRKSRLEYADYLVSVAEMAIEEGRKAVGSYLIPKLREFKPEVTLAHIEFRTWRELAEFAQKEELAFVETSGHDFIVDPTTRGSKRAEKIKARIRHGFEHTHALRSQIKEAIGADLPSAETRFLIFAQTQWVLNDSREKAELSLIDLSVTVAKRLIANLVDQNTVFRLLNGLNYIGALDTVANPRNPKDRIVIRLITELAEMDDAFLLNLTRLLRKKSGAQLDSARLSVVFYGNEGEHAKVARMLSIATEAAASDKPRLRLWLQQLKQLD